MDERFTARPRKETQRRERTRRCFSEHGATQMIQYGVAALEKATILLVYALSWIIWRSSEPINITLTEY